MKKIFLAILLFNLEFVYANVWLGSDNSRWREPLNWKDGLIPDGIGQSAFFNHPTRHPNITIEGPVTLGFIGFDASQNYTISGDSLIFQQAGDEVAVIETRPPVRGTSSNLVIQSNVQLNSRLDLDPRDPNMLLVLSGAITGMNELRKDGSGIAQLTGHSTYSGPTFIEAGILFITGSITSDVNVAQGATLVHNGTTGSVTNAGTKVVGGSIGASVVLGDYVQMDSGVLALEIEDSPQISDQVFVTGNAVFDGFLALDPFPGIYLDGTLYPFFQANTISGTLIPLESTVEYEVLYQTMISPNTLTFRILGNHAVLPVSLSSLSRNARNIAEVLFDLPSSLDSDFLALLQLLVGLPPEQFSRALIQLSPQNIGALSLSNLQSHVRITESMNRIDHAFLRSHFQSECFWEQNQSIWVNPIGYYYDQDVMEGQRAFIDRMLGLTIGYQTTFLNGLYASFGSGYTYSFLDWKKGYGNAKLQNIYLTPSVGYIGQYGYAGIALTGSMSFYDVDRKIKISSIHETAKNHHLGYNLVGAFEGGLLGSINSLYISPVFRIQYLNFFETSYKETGADLLSLSVKDHYSSYLQPKILFKIIKSFTNSSTTVLPAIYFGYLSNIPLTSGQYEASFYRLPNRTAFRNQSYHETRGQVILGAEIDISRYCNQRFGFKYEANLNSKSIIQEASIDYNYYF